jgi:hypothetical protein
MPTAPKFPQIPIPDGSPESMLQAMVSVIQTLQTLTTSGPKSQSGAQTDRNMAHTFVQDTQPTAINPGDFWLCQKPKVSLSCWTGDRWSHLIDAS